MAANTFPVSASKDALKCLGIAFENFRRSSGKQKCHYPETLKSRAIASVQGLSSIPKVSSECGISPKSLQLWIRAIPPQVRRLSVVAEEPNSIENSETPQNAQRDQSAKFVFRIAQKVVVETSADQALWLIEKLGGQD